MSAFERKELEAFVANRNSPQKHVWRAKIILLRADAHSTAEIMLAAGKAKTVIWRWQERFARKAWRGFGAKNAMTSNMYVTLAKIFNDAASDGMAQDILSAPATILKIFSSIRPVQGKASTAFSLVSLRRQTS